MTQCAGLRVKSERMRWTTPVCSIASQIPAARLIVVVSPEATRADDFELPIEGSEGRR